MDDNEKKYVANFSLALKEFRGKYGRKGQVGGSSKDPSTSTTSGKTKKPDLFKVIPRDQREKGGKPSFGDLDYVDPKESKSATKNSKQIQLTPKQRALEMAKKFGFPPERLVFSSAEVDEYGNWANYDPATKKITLFKSLLNDEWDAETLRWHGGLEAVVHHEIAHAQIGENYGILDNAFEKAFGKGSMKVYGNIDNVTPPSAYTESILRRAKQTKYDMRIYGNECFAELSRTQDDERYMGSNDPRWKVFYEACNAGIKKLKIPEFSMNELATEKFPGFKGSVSSNFAVSMDSEWTPCEPRDAAFAIEITSDGKKSFIMRPPG
jgi:hypothetical protein